MGHFVGVCRSLKVNADESKMIMLDGEKGLEHEVMVTTCQNINTWDVFWMNHIEMNQCYRKVAGAIRSLVYDRVLHEIFLMPVLMYRSEV